MKLHLHQPDQVNRINGYGVGYFIINGERIKSNTIITATTLITQWGPMSIHDLCPTHLEVLLQQQPEVILLGTGSSQVFPDSSVYSTLTGTGVGIEVMTSAAACRTYDILVSEQRQVAAALFLINS